MPLYEYQCAAGGHRGEVRQQHSDPAPGCETCTEAMTRQISAGAFHLAGDGWARDNYGLKGD